MIALGFAPEGAPRWRIQAAEMSQATGHAASAGSRVRSIRAGVLLFPLAMVLAASCGAGQVPKPKSSTAAASASAVTLMPESTGSSSSRRVIVTLSVPVTPEGNMPSQQAANHQRQSVVEAQDALLTDLKPFAVRVLARFNGPQLALLVDDDALRYLRSSPRVASVQEDIPKPPGG
jgi:hypothetical protein